MTTPFSIVACNASDFLANPSTSNSSSVDDLTILTSLENKDSPEVTIQPENFKKSSISRKCFNLAEMFMVGIGNFLIYPGVVDNNYSHHRIHSPAREYLRVGKNGYNIYKLNDKQRLPNDLKFTASEFLTDEGQILESEDGKYAVISLDQAYSLEHIVPNHSNLVEPTMYDGCRYVTLAQKDPTKTSWIQMDQKNLPYNFRNPIDFLKEQLANGNIATKKLNTLLGYYSDLNDNGMATDTLLRSNSITPLTPETFNVADVSKNLASSIIQGAVDRLKSVGVNVKMPNDITETWADMIGSDKVKDTITTELGPAFGEERELMNNLTRITRGKPIKNYSDLILFTGEPGVGKTKAAAIAAKEHNVPFIEIAAHNIKDKYHGQTEKNIDLIFSSVDKLESGRRIQGQQQGAIMFLDEIDSLITSRDSMTGDNLSRNILTSFLTKITGSRHSQSNRILVCATNKPNDLDSAFLSRVGRVIHYPPPTFVERMKFFEVNALHLEKNAIEQLAKYSEGMVPRDIFSVLDISERTFIQNMEKDAELTTGPPMEVYLQALTERFTLRKSVMQNHE